MTQSLLYPFEFTCIETKLWKNRI